MRIIDTDNFASDYPDEKFILGVMTRKQAQRICDCINATLSEHGDWPRYYSVVDDDYQLQPGFQPRLTNSNRG